MVIAEWARSRTPPIRFGRKPARGQEFVLRAGSHNADGLDGAKEDLGKRIAIFIRLPNPNEGHRGKEAPGGAITAADESAKARDSKAAPLRQRKESWIPLKIEQEMIPPLTVVSSIELEVGHGVMLEPGEVLHVVEDICVLCFIHLTRTERVMDPGDDKD
jgi:hypothetical protein